MTEFRDNSYHELSPREYIEKELQPHLEVDQGNFKRKIFRRGEITFSFKGREEMPIYDTAKESATHLIGKRSRHTDASEVLQYQTEFAHEAQGEHYIIDKSLFGIVELARVLGNKDEELQQLAEELQQGKYSEKAFSLIDDLVIANSINDQGELSDKPNTQAEAVVLLSLLGDKNAQSILHKKKEIFLQLEKNFKTEKKETQENTAEPFDLKELVCVHATQYMPKRNEDGQYQIQTTSDATDNRLFRNTVHFALNHKVGAHGGGSWAGAGVVLISPFEKMMQLNDRPAVLNTVDTYWAQNPGTPVNLPEESLIVLPGGKEVVGLFERKGNQVFSKSEGFSKSDIQALVELQKGNSSDDKMNFLAMRIWHMYPETFKTLEESLETIKQILSEDGEELSISEQLQSGFASLINEESVKYGIREAGFEEFSGALESQVTKRTDKLAELLGVDTIAHSGTLHSKVETTIYDRIQGATRDFFSGQEHPFDWKKFSLSPNGYTFLMLDPPTRRSLYESGYLNTREK